MIVELEIEAATAQTKELLGIDAHISNDGRRADRAGLNPAAQIGKTLQVASKLKGHAVALEICVHVGESLGRCVYPEEIIGDGRTRKEWYRESCEVGIVLRLPLKSVTALRPRCFQSSAARATRPAINRFCAGF